MRWQNDAGVAPAARRVHCTRRNDSGRSGTDSGVASTHTGMMNALLRAIMCERCSAMLHSSRK